jgi:acetolactate synthase-1/2/3 large subunit
MISGGGAMHLNDSLGKTEALTYYCNHHEQASAIAAEGYARASNELAVVNVTTGPGGTNTLTGVIGQWLDSVPVLYLSGQVKFETTISSCPELGLRQLGDQEINIVDIVKPVTKYAAMVTNANEIRKMIDKAIYIATHGRPGPVWLDIPLNIQATMINEKELLEYDEKEDELIFDGNGLKKSVEEVIQKIKDAERPVLLVGQGVRISGAQNEFIELAERLNVPVLTAICAHDLIWTDHPLFFGRPGICGDRIGNVMVQNSDFLLIVGARMGIRQISYNYTNFAPKAYKVMVDIDRAEMDKPTLKIDMKVSADAKLFLSLLLDEQKKSQLKKGSEWIEWGNERKNSLPTIFQDNTCNPGFVDLFRFLDQLFEELGPDDLVVTGNGTAYTSTFQAMNIKKGMRVFANQGCASMGYDLPAAIGASIARGKKRVILITGDGSIMMNIQELQTIAHYQLPVKIFILENNGYLAIRTTQQSFFNSRYIASHPDSGVSFPDFCSLAKAFKIKAYRLKRGRNFSSQIQKVISMDGPVLCEIRMDPDQTLYPKVASAARPDGTMVSKPLEDMAPFLSEEELHKCYCAEKSN